MIIGGAIEVYKEELHSKSQLNSAMDALDRLGKEYEIHKILQFMKNSENLKKLTGEKERKVEYWIIEEKSNRKVDIDGDTSKPSN